MFEIGLKKIWSDQTEIAPEKKYLEIKNLQTPVYFFYVTVKTGQAFLS